MRAGAVLMVLLAYALALIVSVDETISVGVLALRLLLVGGIIAATLITWAVQYTLRLQMTRRVLFPWGALGGAAMVLLIVGQSQLLGDHPLFVATTFVRAAVLAFAVRWTIDLIFGPLEVVVAWGSTTGELATPATMKEEDLAALPADALRPAWAPEPEQAPGRRTLSELKLVSEDEDTEPSRARHKRPSA